MPAPATRRPRHLMGFVAAVLVAGVLTGCMGQQEPGEYSESVRRDFVAGCDGSAFDDEPNAEELQEGSLPTAQCECAYDAIERDVDFDDFKRINTELRETPGPMDPLIMDAAADCFTAGGASTEQGPAGDDEGADGES